MQDKRLDDILKAAVEEFIRTGDPVGSAFLYEKYNFGIKPARIRSELQELTERGYLVQPHTSAGRVPTDRGYMFFVECILEEKEEPSAISHSSFLTLLKRFHFDDFAEQISEAFGVLSVLEDVDGEAIYKRGLDELIANLAWDSREEIKSIVRDFEDIDERIGSLHGILEEGETKVFIGSESPVTRSEALAVVAKACHQGSKRPLVLAIGPKRMNYKKVIHTFHDF